MVHFPETPDTWQRHPDYEIYNGEHTPTPTHTCQISRPHAHKVGNWESYFEVPQLEPLTSRAVFAGDNCPICDLFGNDVHALIPVDDDGDRYYCTADHVMTHNELSHMFAKFRADEGAEDVINEPETISMSDGFVIDTAWTTYLAGLLDNNSYHTAAVEIWKEIHRT